MSNRLTGIFCGYSAPWLELRARLSQDCHRMRLRERLNLVDTAENSHPRLGGVPWQRYCRPRCWPGMVWLVSLNPEIRWPFRYRLPGNHDNQCHGEAEIRTMTARPFFLANSVQLVLMSKTGAWYSKRNSSTSPRSKKHSAVGPKLGAGYAPNEQRQSRANSHFTFVVIL
jgi:hypothetical protein